MRIFRLLKPSTFCCWSTLLNPPSVLFISWSFSFRFYQWCFTLSYNVVRKRSEERQRKVNCRFKCLLSQSSVNPQVFFHLTSLCVSICTLICQPANLLLAMKNVRIMGHNQTVVLWLHIRDQNYCLNKAHHFPQGKNLTSCCTASDNVYSIWEIYFSHFRGRLFPKI